MAFIRSTLAAALLFTICIPSLHAHPQGGNVFAYPYPETGRWGPRDGSRTGIFLEIQNGIAAGLWAGHDSEGEAVWLSFSGTLDPLTVEDNDDVQVGWKLTSELTEFSGGGCIVIGDACAGGESTGDFAGEFRHFIRLRFTDRSMASLEVLPAAPEIITPPGNFGGPQPDTTPIFGPINNVPLYFGVDAPAFGQTLPMKRIPDFEGVWAAALAITNTVDIENANGDYEAGGIVRIGPREIETFESDPPMPGDLVAEVRHPVLEDTLGRIPEDSEIVCRVQVRFDDTSQTLINCIILTPNILEGFIINDYSDTQLNVWISSDVSSPIIDVLQLHRLNYD